MITQLIAGFLLMALCVAIHGFGLMTALRWVNRGASNARLRPAARTLIRIASWTIGLHLLEIVVWAAFYAWRHAMPDFPTAAYFSAVTYTTTGYGDLVLPETWRLVGAVEALTGILMCGWSTGFFFAVVSRMYQESVETRQP